MSVVGPILFVLWCAAGFAGYIIREAKGYENGSFGSIWWGGPLYLLGAWALPDRRKQANQDDFFRNRNAANQSRSRPAPESWWNVLGIAPDATMDQVTQAWRELARESHPDRA